MTKDEIAKLKEHLRHAFERERAELERQLREKYDAKLKAVALVEEMLNEIEPSSPETTDAPAAAASISLGSIVVPAMSSANMPIPTIDDRIEATFKRCSGWTVPEVQRALGLMDHQRGTVWNAVQRLVEAKKVRVIRAGAGRRAAQYGWMEEEGTITANPNLN